MTMYPTFPPTVCRVEPHACEMREMARPIEVECDGDDVLYLRRCDTGNHLHAQLARGSACCMQPHIVEVRPDGTSVQSQPDDSMSALAAALVLDALREWVADVGARRAAARQAGLGAPLN